MLAFSFAAIAAVLSFASTVLAQNGVCQAAPYNALACLGDVPEAKAACKAVPRQTKTVTVTTTTLDVMTSSITQMAASQNQITVEITSSENRTVTVTKGPMSTVTDIQLSTYSENATVTTYLPCAVISAAAVAPTASLAAEESCNAADALPALASITADAELATACSCMGNPVPTFTTTEIINAPAVQATTTAVDGTPKTTTLYAITLVTYTETVAPLTTIAVSSATTETATSTLSLAAPTYSAVFGPKAGCADINVGPAKTLDSNITSMREAVKECKEICAQEPKCEFLYVQHMFENWGGREPYYVCQMNKRHLKERRDLRCGKKESIFGVARGFDAYDRGIESA